MFVHFFVVGLYIAFSHAVLDICHSPDDNIGTYEVRLPLWFAPKYDTKKKHARRRRGYGIMEGVY